jgi:hypothetical protein
MITKMLQKNGRLSNCGLWFAFVQACLLLMVASLAAGQSSSLMLTGTVVDTRGALFVGSKVLAVNVETSVDQHILSGNRGTFTFETLLPGSYHVRVSSGKFSPAEARHLALNVEDRGSVGNLPLNGRSLQSLVELTPDVAPQAADGNHTEDQFSVNGHRTNENYFTVDGVTANICPYQPSVDFRGQTGAAQSQVSTILRVLNVLVSIDALQEIRIQTSTYTPEFGRTRGWQISRVTDSGTSTCHGYLFEQSCDDALDSNDWFVNKIVRSKTRPNQSDFGQAFGGPICQRDTFFFGSYEDRQVEFHRTLIHGMQLSVTYTISPSSDTTPNGVVA